MRALRLALVSRRPLRAWACPEEAANIVTINTAANAWVHTLKPDGDRNIYEDSCALAFFLIPLRACTAHRHRPCGGHSPIRTSNAPIRVPDGRASIGMRGFDGKWQGFGRGIRQGAAGVCAGYPCVGSGGLSLSALRCSPGTSTT